MHMRLMAKSTAAEIEKKAEEDGLELSKAFDEVMSGLDSFVKSSVASKADTKETEKDADKESDGAILKSLQDVADGKDAAVDAARARQAEIDRKANELAKSLSDSDDSVEELDGAKVFAELKQTMAKMVAKAITAIREDMTAQLGKMQDGQVLIAKSLSVNGKLLKEAMHEVAVIGEQPRGRKSALTMFDKAMSGNGGAGETKVPMINVKSVMAKALELNLAKKISPNDVSVINHYVTGGHGIPPQFVHMFPESDISQ